MNPRLWFLFALTARTALHADIQLRGVLQRDDKYMVALWDSTQKNTSAEWVAIGGRFGEFTVQSYDPWQERVRLRTGDRIVEAWLPGAISHPSLPDLPSLIQASVVVLKEGRRCCPLHGEPLKLEKGFLLPPDVYACPSLPMMITSVKYKAEYPNKRHRRVSPTPEFYRSAEVKHEYCASCEKAFIARMESVWAEQ